jgi:hypothetical protein
MKSSVKILPNKQPESKVVSLVFPDDLPLTPEEESLVDLLANITVDITLKQLYEKSDNVS